MNFQYKIVTTPDGLPAVRPGDDIFMDFETTNVTDKGDKKDSMVWHGDRICGAAITINDYSEAWYIPVRHTTGTNLDLQTFQRWLKDSVTLAGRWINHNIKFDAHFAAEDGAEFQCSLVDTMVQARSVHNNLPEYGLKELSAKYLEADNWKDEIQGWLTAHKSVNYADVPIDMMARYAAGGDIHYNRKLYHFLERKIPEESRAVWEMEKLLTPVLYDLEVQGLLIDPNEIQVEYDCSIDKQQKLQRELWSNVGWKINVNSSQQLHELIVKQLGLPVVAWTDPKKNKSHTSNPSFGAEAMGLYESLPEVLSDQKVRGTLKQIQKLVEEKHFFSLFLKNYLNLHVGGVIHPTYIQCKKTGRMACKQPNSQQLNKRAKALVKNLPGHKIWSWDYSQIEYRLIVHYTDNKKAIKAYNDNPKTDYHDWVAALAGIMRDPAKTLNFLLAFGGGKRKAKQLLAKIDDVINEVNGMIDRIELRPDQDRAEFFRQLFDTKAESIYNRYHAAQPELKRTMDLAAAVAEERGYVKTIMGRRSYIPRDFSYRAFNAVIQGSAADIMKNRLIYASPRYNKAMRQFGIKPFAVVHDDYPQQVPTDVIDKHYISLMKRVLEDIPFEIKVPILVSYKKHEKNWAA